MLVDMTDRIVVRILVLGSVLVFLVSMAIQYYSTLPAPSFLVASEAPLPTLSATAWGIFDPHTGVVLLGTAATTTYPIASVTKLITAATLLQATNTTATVTISWRDVSTEGRAGGLVPGEQLPLHMLLFPLLLESSNDAATSIEFAAAENFVATMQAWVRQHNMVATVVHDSSGLSPQNISTVQDLATLLSDILVESPHIIDITAMPRFLYGTHAWQNSNPVAQEKGYVGGKNGYTPEAGKTAAVLFAEPIGVNEERVTVGYVILNSTNTAADIAALRAFTQQNISYQ